MGKFSKIYHHVNKEDLKKVHEQKVLVQKLESEIIEKEKKVIELRDQNIPTVPSILKEEKLINPFLRYKDKAIIESVANHYKKEISNSIEVFHHTRMWKDTEYD